MTWFDPRKTPTGNLHLAEGMAMADIFLVPSTPGIDLAVVDSGFPGPDDYAPTNPAVVRDYGWDPSATFASIPQCRVSHSSSSCSWSTLKAEAAGRGDDIPYHGGHVASLALGGRNDGQGVAGIGFPVARPYLVKLEGVGIGGVWTGGNGISRALPDVAGPSTRIVNLSVGANCVADLGLFSFDVCDGVEAGLVTGVTCVVAQFLFSELASVPCAEIAVVIALGTELTSMGGPVADAEAKGVLLVAGAGNGAGTDVNFLRTRPCTMPNVICVGGLTTGLTLAGAKGAAISIYAPAVSLQAMRAPDDPGGAPVKFGGDSGATPLVSGALAVALSIKPTLTTDEARQLLADSACKSSHVVRSDGTSCTPSTDPDVDRVGYLDFLEMVRQARRSAGQDPLRTCTGGWNAEELADSDTFATAIPLPPVSSQLGTHVEYRPVVDDLSIHKIRLGPPSSDEDWYKVTFSLPPPPRLRGLVARFSFRVAEENSSTGMASVTARVRTDVTYFIRVRGSIEDTGIVRVYGGNCYRKVRVDVMDHGAIPAPPCG